ncbi:MAG: AmmeMemoRadiSam system protein B [Sulfurovum sp.]|nr:AmmeMemoRadiSam system protein B [Sulfurovum sp.]
MEAVRKMAVTGSFYPSQCRKIIQMIQEFNQRFDRLQIDPKVRAIIPRAILVPHAGYIYSGYTANFAYRFLAPTKAKRIIVIGPSHKQYFQGISGSFFEKFETPCGDLPIDTPYLFALARRFNIGFVPQAHAKEHSTEVQMPFIQHYFPKKEVIEIIYGDIDEQYLSNLMLAILKNPDNALVVSSDLSHFHPLQEAEAIDRNCLLGVQYLNLSRLQQCEACGITGIKAVTIAAKHLGLSSKLLDYRTSSDTSGDLHSVVGYLSAMFY